MYDVGVKLFNGIKSMYVNSVAFVKVRGSESEYFMVDSSVRQGVSCLLGSFMYVLVQ